MTTPQRVNEGDPRTGGLQCVRAFDALASLGRRGAWLFVNASERRLRAGWRLVAQALLLGLVGQPAVLGLRELLSLLARLAPQTERGLARSLRSSVPLEALAFALLGAVTITLTVWMARRLLDRRTFVSLGLALDRRTVPDLALGFLLAGAAQALMFVSLWAVGWLRITGVNWQTRSMAELVASAVTLAIVFALVGWYEELLARGYWLQNMADGLNRTLAVLLSSSVFACGHFGNPNVTWLALLGIVGAGLLLAWAYLRTGRLWPAIGIHFGWNFFEGPVFGFPVSGVKTMPLIETTMSGPVLWTGGEFGPEAGLILFPALALGALAIGLTTRGRAARSRVD